jgi:cation:H+ antiporter
VVYPLGVSKGTVWKEIPFSLMAALVVALLANDRFFSGGPLSSLSRADGGVLLCFFVVFLYYSYGIAKDIEGMEEHVTAKTHSFPKALLFVTFGLVGLTVGGHWIVKGAVQIAAVFGMSESQVGLTIVAVGTSLPELATSVTAAYNRHVEIAVGNVVGSNIFNIFFVLGISSVIKPLPFQTKSNFDMVIVVISSLLLFCAMFTGKKRSLDRWEGAIFICLYSGYIVFSAVRW